MAGGGGALPCPFPGPGTAPKSATATGRRGIGVEASLRLGRAVRERVSEPFDAQGWSAMGVIRPPAMDTGEGPPRKARLPGGGPAAAPSCSGPRRRSAGGGARGADTAPLSHRRP